MLEGLLKQKYFGIDVRSDREKTAASYLVGLIEQNWNEFNHVLNPRDSTPESELPEKIYSSVVQIMKELESEYCRPFGICTYHFQKGQEPLVPAVQLGWASFIPFSSGQHGLHLTDKGKAVINGYRDAQGYVSLDEQAKINKERSGLLPKAIS
jgi:hypothetical protein